MLRTLLLMPMLFLLMSIPGIGNTTDVQTLASECHLISNHLYELKTDQSSASCTYKLNMAGLYTKLAGDNLLTKHLNEVKQYIRDALEFLRYSEKMPCEKLPEITQVKWDLVTVNKKVYEL
ncbi:hypothetical protein [Legionella waltersii]|uniref:Uncharacterized protein n=1 Tax=Legionella waltersii TaxID=66969 RepID=A0A0W1ADM9_9GAMM|nr:hypothetical protein [Legionella waltersii]KTD79435.1 hypothetical protein Lwal_1507 [Legionella waltersii]SNU97672.1 Uncharacterised protein [Legionella waltersii]